MTERVVVIGDALIDELRDARGVREFVGGAGLNVAVGLSVLGVPTTLIAMVGEDAAGDRIRVFLGTFDVQLIEADAPRGTARAISERAGGAEPVYVFNEAARKRRITFSAEARAAIAAAPVVAISCVAFDNEAQADDLVSVVAERTGALIVDPNPRAGMMNDLAGFVRGFEALVPSADLVKIGDDDARMLYSAGLAEATEKIRDLGAAAVLATAGAEGASVLTADGDVSRPITSLPGAVVDTMGAGDSMTATFAAGLASDAPRTADTWGALLDEALLIAAATVRQEGALLRRPDAEGDHERGVSGS